MLRPRNALLAAALAGGLALGTTALVTLGDAGHSGRAASSPAAAVRVASSPANRSHRARPLVPQLHRLVSPDVVVELDSAATSRQLRALARTSGVRAVTALDRGSVRLGGVRLRTLGVDIRSVRGLTPRYTATSNLLWESVARDEVTIGYSETGRLGRSLGATLPAGGVDAESTWLRVGAFASIGLGNAQAIVDKSLSRTLGLREKRVVIFAAPSWRYERLATLARAVFGSKARVHVVRPRPVNQFVISSYALSIIPPTYLQLYRMAAATCRGLPWTVLAAIGTVETHNGANVHTSSKGAMGPMQFMPATFRAYATDGNGDGVADIMNPADAIYSAARLLCAWGAGLGGATLLDAIWGYNHADWYVREVVQLANAFA